MKEPSGWSRATRKKHSGGIHLYISKELLERALSNADIPVDEEELVLKSHTFKTNWRGRARIMIELKVERKVNQDEQTVYQSNNRGEGKADEQGGGSGPLREAREPLSERENAEGNGQGTVLAQIPTQAGLQNHCGAEVIPWPR